MRAKRMIILLTVAVCYAAAARCADFKWRGAGWWGIRCSFSTKWYSYAAGGKRHQCNFWGEDGYMQGVQFGVPLQPVFSRNGFGISTGVFGEVYSCRNRSRTMRIEDIGLYFPFHALWSKRFNSRVEIHCETGPGLTVGLLQDVIDPKDSTKAGFHMTFDDGSPRRVNWYWEWGVGATFRIFRFSAVYSLGMTPSRHFLSSFGAKDHWYTAIPSRLSFNFGLVF